MYIPKSKYIIRAAKPGEFVETYTGPVIETASGLFFSGEDLTNLSSPLTPTVSMRSVTLGRPYHEYIVPSEEDYQIGTYNRYFFQIKNTKRVVEVSRAQFLEKRNLLDVISISFPWRIKGDLQVIKKRNQTTLDSAKAEIPEILVLIKDPLQFVK